MTQILWASILASAVVAGFVTILIEYLAKPRLEARKERILDAYRQEREALRGLRRAVQRAGIMCEISGIKGTYEALAQDRMRKLGAEVDQLVDAAFVALTAPRSLDHSWKYTAGFISGFMTNAQVDPPDGDAMSQAMPIFEDLELYRTLFEIPRWHWRQRRLIVDELMEHYANRKTASLSDVTSGTSQPKKMRELENAVQEPSDEPDRGVVPAMCQDEAETMSIEPQADDEESSLTSKTAVDPST